MFSAKILLSILCLGCSAERISHSAKQSLGVNTAISTKAANVRVQERSRVSGHTSLERLRVYSVQADADGKCRDVMKKVKAFLELDDEEGRSDATESKEEQDILSGERSSKVLDEIEDVISRSDFERQLEVGEVITSDDLDHLVECETGASSVRLEETTPASASVEDDEDIIEGDILVHKGYNTGDSLMQLNSSQDADESHKWAGTLWPDGRIPYCFHKDFPHHTRNTFRQAAKEFGMHSCVRWVEVDSETDKRCAEKPSVMVKSNKPGCSSFVGKSFRILNSQRLNLQQGCHSRGTILHEMGHTVGMAHEHVRSDRDKFVKIHWQNMPKSTWHNFKTDRSAATIDPYEYSSLMHYTADSFANEWGQNTITDLSGGVPRNMGQRAGFTRQDWDLINKMYQCQRR
eukprot:TRINITY_DN3327_c3_g2_i1.p1 TRINITY_DN3327_c3_g2~~TRINITY_DN3327_c3_g2_i1.p1  ORF type:complete len:404 (-),score=53.87 TRINITY_DN3327_c3_g2_i1:122-1333(-)